MENWEKEFDKLCTGGSGNITWAVQNTDMKAFIHQLLSDQRQEMVKKAKEILQRECLDYCREQNGLEHCKNCGLDENTLSALLTN